MTRLESGPTGTQKSTAWYGLGAPGTGLGIGSTGMTDGDMGACCTDAIVVVSATWVVVVTACSCTAVAVVLSIMSGSWVGAACAEGLTARSTGISATGAIVSSTGLTTCKQKAAARGGRPYCLRPKAYNCTRNFLLTSCEHKLPTTRSKYYQQVSKLTPFGK